MISEISVLKNIVSYSFKALQLHITRDAQWTVFLTCRIYMSCKEPTGEKECQMI